jgi:hypothetical protein
MFYDFGTTEIYGFLAPVILTGLDNFSNTFASKRLYLLTVTLFQSSRISFNELTKF